VAVPAYRISRAARLLGVSRDTMRRWADAGRVKTVTDAGGHVCVDGAALARLAVELGHEPDRTGRQSLRNRFPGIVTRVLRDGVAAQVEVQAGPHRLVALITREAADELGLEPGMLADGVVKATSMSIELPADA
jgi:molybdopterin-binding protein